MTAWPGTLPQYVLEQGYSEQFGKQTIETDMDVGPAKRRQRTTTSWRQFQVNINMTPAQAATFETFFQTTLAGGTLPFTWVHPRTRAAATFRFRNPPPKISVKGEAWMHQCAMEMLA